MSRKPKILAAAILLCLAPVAGAQGTTGTPGTAPTPPSSATPVLGVPGNRIAGLFERFLGSRENAVALVHGLRTGTSVTLVAAAPCPAPCTTPPAGTEVAIDVATRPMGWGNVRHALALAQYSLAQAGITNPTPEQIAAALNGGTVTTSSGATLELNGILSMRAAGMGWGQIAHAEGTSMGSVNRELKPFKVGSTGTAPAPATAPAAPVPPANLGKVATAASASPGVVTAGSARGNGAGHWQAGRGIVTGNGGAAPGVSTGGRIATGHGNGHGNGAGGGATGHGGGNAGNANGHAHIAGAGVTTAANAAASAAITTAQGPGNGHGRGHGGGNGNGNGRGGK